MSIAAGTKLGRNPLENWRGREGEMYRAQDAKLDRKVALKDSACRGCF